MIIHTYTLKLESFIRYSARKRLEKEESSKYSEMEQFVTVILNSNERKIVCNIKCAILNCVFNIFYKIHINDFIRIGF